ncbi:MAG TPA: hypothetical protein VKR60_02135 [Candidatus Sulfotelmatobacter sp.]|nr:hypothetical protein [Candidatus Sulfotelmatobacter sp.]
MSVHAPFLALSHLPQAAVAGLGELWARYPCASHGRAIVAVRGMGQTSSIMDIKPGVLKGEGKSEKLSLLVLGVCIAALVTILLIRPF